MSSFKRKSTTKQTDLLTGTRISPASPSTLITSTGIPSLDDILGGGLPLSCSLLVLAPDPHSSYGELVQKYFIAQGLACGQQVCVVDDCAKKIASECMWLPGSPQMPSDPMENEEDERGDNGRGNVTIAWRYENMKQFQTTIPAPNQLPGIDYCHTFDLTHKIPSNVLDRATRNADLVFMGVSGHSEEKSTTSAISKISGQLRDSSRSGPLRPTRICVPALASPQWGDLDSQDILHFLHQSRALLRQYPHATAIIALPAYASTDEWGGSAWIQKLSWLTDASVTLAAFTADLSLSTVFPSYHGFLNIHTVPSPHTLLPASDRLSVLRGLSATSGSSGGGENNLAFKCMRKRLVFETLHLDVEGGIGERRTTPATYASVLQETGMGNFTESSVGPRPGASLVTIEVEGDSKSAGEQDGKALEGDPKSIRKPAKAKKKVAFHSNKPDLYDF